LLKNILTPMGLLNLAAIVLVYGVQLIEDVNT
jgi:hypothetical protein